MNSITLKRIYDNAKEAGLSDIAAESLAYFANKNERYISDEISTESVSEFGNYFKGTLVPTIKGMRDANTELSFEDISESVQVGYDIISSASVELSRDDDVITISNAYTKPKNGIYIEACEFIAPDEETYIEKVSEITSVIGDIENFVPVVEATGIETFVVKYLYPCNKEMDNLVGIENVTEWLSENSYKDHIATTENIEDITIKDVDGVNVAPMESISAESIIDYVASVTSKSLYGQMKDVYDRYGEESVQFEKATKLYSKIAKIGAESIVTSMCVCGALGIPYDTSKIVYHEMFDED